jgi:transposase
MLCDSLGRPLRLHLTAGQKADCQSAIGLREGQRANAVVADKGYDTDSIRAFI